MRVLVKAMLDAIPALGNVVLLMLFIFFLWGVVAVQLFGGKLRQRCVHAATGSVLDEEEVCATSGWGQRCPANYSCTPYDADGAAFDNPEDGFVGFDNILLAVLTLFANATLEGWWEVMFMVRARVRTASRPAWRALTSAPTAHAQMWDSSPAGAWATLHYLSLVVVGAFFALNLVTAVIVDAHHKSFEVRGSRPCSRAAQLTIAPAQDVQARERLKRAMAEWGLHKSGGRTWESRCRHFFQQFDQDGSGAIDAQELQNVFKLLGQELEADKVRACQRRRARTGRLTAQAPASCPPCWVTWTRMVTAW